MYTTLISVEQLKDMLASGQACTVFDCSFDLFKPLAGEAMYAETHIAGAIYANLDKNLSAAKDTNTGKPAAGTSESGGRHPLPTRQAFADWLGSVGFDNTQQAVVYDRQGANYCGRLWWMLKWAGHDNVAILDGGLQAWQAAGGAVESGTAAAVAPKHFTLAAPQAVLATVETVVQGLAKPAAPGAQTVIDARATPRFRGEVEPIDPVAGHIPGALNRPFAANFAADGRFKSATELRAEFDVLLAGRDAGSVVHHCGSGVSAVPNIVAMELAGLGRAALFAGSWSEWCSDPSRPVAQG